MADTDWAVAMEEFTKRTDDVTPPVTSAGDSLVTTDHFMQQGNVSENISIWNDTLGNPEYYSLPYMIVGVLFTGSIFLVGIVGNIMVVIVVSRTRSLHTPTNCYLVSLAVADVLLLISAPLPTLIEYFTIIDQCVIGRVGCSIMVFCQYLGINTSSLSITAFTIERYIAICHPMRAQTMCTVRRAKRIILGLWTFGICYCAPWLALTVTKPRYFKGGLSIQMCTFKLQRPHYVTYYMADLVIFYVVPLLLTCILYGLIGRILFQSSLITSNRGKSSAATNGSNSGDRGNKKSTPSARVQVVKMLIIVVLMFAVLWLPYRVYVVYNSFTHFPYHDYWFRMFCRTMVYINSAINPILYNALSVKFRRAYRKLLQCGNDEKSRNMTYVNYMHYTQVGQGSPHVRIDQL